jgi:hypothetical protein
MQHLPRLLVAVVLAAAGCERAVPVSQFGACREPTQSLRLAGGDELPVYRVKHWTFANGSPPALQLEYEAPFDVADSAAARRFARALWPVFAPYAEAAGTPAAIVTATNLRRRGEGTLWVARMRHYGLVAGRGADGRWRLDGEAVALPPALADVGGPKGPGIFEPDGAPLPPLVGGPVGQR